MFRLLGSGLLGAAMVGVWIYCILDVIATNESLVRNLPKMAWLFVVAFIPTVGAIAWLALGRPLYVGWRPGSTQVRTNPVARGPEDAADFTSRSDQRAQDLQTWEDDLLRREKNLRPPDGKGEAPPGGVSG